MIKLVKLFIFFDNIIMYFFNQNNIVYLLFYFVLFVLIQNFCFDFFCMFLFKVCVCVVHIITIIGVIRDVVAIYHSKTNLMFHVVMSICVLLLFIVFYLRFFDLKKNCSIVVIQWKQIFFCLLVCVNVFCCSCVDLDTSYF